jgi:hypothetical protein
MMPQVAAPGVSGVEERRASAFADRPRPCRPLRRAPTNSIMILSGRRSAIRIHDHEMAPPSDSIRASWLAPARLLPWSRMIRPWLLQTRKPVC